MIVIMNVLKDQSYRSNTDATMRAAFAASNSVELAQAAVDAKGINVAESIHSSVEQYQELARQASLAAISIAEWGEKIVDAKKAGGAA